MTTVTMVDGTMTVDLAAAGIADELADRLAGVGDDQSGPGPPPSVLIAGRRVGVGTEPVLVGRGARFGIDHPRVSRRHVGVQRVEGVLIATDHPRVSRRHVGVQRVEGVLIATDVGSRNGTWLVRDGERSRLTPMAVLRPGDRLVTLDDVELVDVDASCDDRVGAS